MLEPPPGVAWQACRRLVAERCGLVGGGVATRGQCRAKACVPSLEEVEELEEASLASRNQNSEGLPHHLHEPSSSSYFNRPRLEDDFYVRPSTFGEFAQEAPNQPGVVLRDPFFHQYPRDPGFVNFRRMEEPEEVLNKLQDLATSIGPGQVEAAFSKLKLFNPSPSTQFLDQVTATCKSHILEMNLWQVCCMFQACARMNYRNVELLDALSQVVLEHTAPLSVDPRHLANLFYAIGLFHRRKSGVGKVKFGNQSQTWPLQGKLVNYLLDTMRGERFINELTEHDAISVLYGFGQLLLSDVKDIVLLIYKHLNQPNLISQLTEVQIMTLLSSFTQTGVRYNPLVQSVITELLNISSLSLFRDEELSTIVYSLGVLKINDPKAAAVLSMVFEEVVRPERLEEISERCLVNIVYGLGQQKPVQDFDNSSILPILFEEVVKKDRLHKYTNQGICNLIYTMGILRYGQGKPMAALISELMRGNRLAQTTSQGITISLWGMAKVQHQDDEFLGFVSKEILKPGRLSTFAENGVSISMYSLGVLGYWNKELVQKMTREVSLPERMSNFGLQDRSNIAYALGRWSRFGVDKKLASGLIKDSCSLENLQDSAEQHLVNILQCVVALKFTDPVVIRNLLDEMSRPQRTMQYKAVEFSAILLGVSRLTSMGLQPRADLLWKKGLQPKKLESYTEAALSGLGFGIGLYKLTSKPLLSDFMHEITKPARLSAFNNADLSNLIFSMVTRGVEDSRGLCKLIKELGQHRRRGTLVTHNIVTTVSGLTKISNPTVANTCMDHALDILKDPAVQAKFECNQMCILLSNLSFHNPLPGSVTSFHELVEKLCEKLKVGVEKLELRHAARMVQCMGQLKLRSHEVFLPLCDSILDEDRLKALDDKQLSYMFTNISKASLPMKTTARMLPVLVMEMDRRKSLQEKPSVELFQIVQSLGRVRGPGVRAAFDTCFWHLNTPSNIDCLDSSQWGRIMDMVAE